MKKDNVIGINGKTINTGKPPIYNMRLCLVGQDDIDIKNIQTFGIAEDGFFMVKSHDNPKLPIFMINPIRVKSVEIFKKGETPSTKLTKAETEDDFIIDLLRKNNATVKKT